MANADSTGRDQHLNFVVRLQSCRGKQILIITTLRRPPRGHGNWPETADHPEPGSRRGSALKISRRLAPVHRISFLFDVAAYPRLQGPLPFTPGYELVGGPPPPPRRLKKGPA